MIKYGLMAGLFIYSTSINTNPKATRDAILVELQKSIDLWYDKPGSIQAREHWDPLFGRLLELDYAINAPEETNIHEEGNEVSQSGVIDIASKRSALHDIIHARYDLSCWEKILARKKWIIKNHGESPQQLEDLKEDEEFVEHCQKSIAHNIDRFLKMDGYTGSEWFKLHVLSLNKRPEITAKL